MRRDVKVITRDEFIKLFVGVDEKKQFEIKKQIILGNLKIADPCQGEAKKTK